MGGIDRLGGHDHSDRPDDNHLKRSDCPDQSGTIDSADRSDTDADQARRVEAVMARILGEHDWDTEHLTDEDRKKYLDADPSRPIPEHEIERLTRQRDICDYWGPRANLPGFMLKDPVDYVRTNAPDRPWLQPALGRDRYLNRVFASIDSGGGHFLQRHEGHAADPQRLTDRLIYRHDPAQTDHTKREQMLDGTKPSVHHCGDTATAIKGPVAFAAAFARAVERPEVRRVLESSDVNAQFDPIAIPIAELLGPDGHQDCVGYRLLPIDGDLAAAKKNRNNWAKAIAAGLDPSVPSPALEEVDSFEGGTIKLVFTANSSQSGWEVLTMYPEPAKEGA